LALGEKYHAFSGSSLQNYTLPTSPATYAPYSDEAVETVNEPAATQMITQFLGTAPTTPTTPPLDQYGNPESTAVPATTVPATNGTTAPTSGSSSTPTTKPIASTTAVPYYDPRPC
jgi:hypothetical protein